MCLIIVSGCYAERRRVGDAPAMAVDRRAGEHVDDSVVDAACLGWHQVAEEHAEPCLVRPGDVREDGPRVGGVGVCDVE